MTRTSLLRILLFVTLLGLLSASPPAAEADEITLCVTVSRANVREGPGLSYRILKTKSHGDVVTVWDGPLQSQDGSPYTWDRANWHAVVLGDGGIAFMHRSTLGSCAGCTRTLRTLPQPQPLSPEAERRAHGATVHVISDYAKAWGTGVVVGRDGLTFLTAFHVILNEGTNRYDCCPYIGPYLSWTLRGEVRGRRSDLDAAVVRVRSDRGLFAVVPMGRSSALRPGDTIHILSYPGRASGSLLRTSGIFLGNCAENVINGNVIWASAPSFPGSSGGLVVNGRGEMVGLLVGSYADERGLPDLGYPELKTISVILPIDAIRAALGHLIP